jgi:acrylyl-CoA reductase (NADPH)
MFKALILSKDDEQLSREITELDDTALPAGDVTVDIKYSTVNYKDGLVLNGLGGLVKTYPHVPGIDFAGIVRESSDERYAPGDEVVLTGWLVGERHWGGYAERARVKGDWLVPLPKGLRLDQAMAIGTAGFTAMLAVMALEEQGVRPGERPVLVPGAAGGVGSVAISLLAELGHGVAASTGRSELHDYLKGLGASEIVDRAELSEPPSRPLDKERWAGCVDAVGGDTLSRVLTQMAYGGAVAAVGLAGGNKLNTTVIPFLLRGVRLIGIDSVMCPRETRLTAWERLSAELPKDKLDAATNFAKFEDLPDLGSRILEGKVKGRTVVEIA